MTRRHRRRGDLPWWRKQQLDAEAGERDAEANRRLGVLFDFVGDFMDTDFDFVVLSTRDPDIRLTVCVCGGCGALVQAVHREKHQTYHAELVTMARELEALRAAIEHP